MTKYLRKLKKISTSRNALEIGKAAEHLVCADLILQGYKCYLSDQGLPYDIVVDAKCGLLKVQVKSSCFPKNVNASGRAERIAYSFHARVRGKNSSARLSNSDCDIVALVGLDIKVIAYFSIHEVGQTMQLMIPNFEFKGKFKRRRFDGIEGFPIEKAIKKFLEWKNV